MEKRKKVGVYALVALGLILAMGFAPMERGMAADTAEPSTEVMEQINIESYEGSLFIVVPMDLGNFDGAIVLVMEQINIESIEALMEYLGLDEYIPYVMEQISIESLPDTVIFVLEDEDIASMDSDAVVPVLMATVSISDSGVYITPFVMEQISVESIGNIEPLVMEQINIE